MERPVHDVWITWRALPSTGEARARAGTSGQGGYMTGQLSGCESLASEPYPGLAYDPEQRAVVGWAGGETVYIIDLAARQCITRVFSANAPGPQVENGTHGRFRYLPGLRGFVLANDPDDDVYLLRLAP